jgi:hypothetical protein
MLQVNSSSLILVCYPVPDAEVIGHDRTDCFSSFKPSSYAIIVGLSNF